MKEERNVAAVTEEMRIRRKLERMETEFRRECEGMKDLEGIRETDIIKIRNRKILYMAEVESLIRNLKVGDCGLRPGLMIPVTGSVYALVQIGFLGYESSCSGGELWSRTGWRCEGSDIRIGGYFRL